VGERPLGIPTIRDRVVQTAARLVLEPIFEADFDEAAYGYRPGRGALDAVEEVHKALREGRTQVVDADLSSYFDSIPHTELMKCLARRISDGKMLHLLKMWLKVPVEERDDQGRPRMSGGKRSRRGIPQGGAISPLLANVYMHRFIRAFRQYGLGERYGAKLVTYADDFVILCRHGAEQVLVTVRRWMSRMGLSINERKTSVRGAWRQTFDFLGYTFGQLYSPKRQCFYLGARPSKKAAKRLREAVHRHLHRGVVAPWEEVVTSLNRTLRGWGNYFRYGTVAPTREALDWYVYERVRDYQRRRRKLSTRGCRTYSFERVHTELGVVSLKALTVGL
jgi:RNA-directed DNA polymerase